MGRSRTSRAPILRTLLRSVAVAASIGVGWSIAPSGVHAVQDGSPTVVVREPLDLGVATDHDHHDEAVIPAASPRPATHAVVVDSDLDLDTDFAVVPGH